MNICIAGGRNFTDYKLMETKLLSYFTENYNIRFLKEECIILCGKAKGVDTLGEKFGKTYCKHVEYFPAEWNKYGKSAGYRRNVDMAKKADYVFVFWDGMSKGSKHMINISKQLNKIVKIIRY